MEFFPENACFSPVERKDYAASEGSDRFHKLADANCDAMPEANVLIVDWSKDSWRTRGYFQIPSPWDVAQNNVKAQVEREKTFGPLAPQSTSSTLSSCSVTLMRNGPWFSNSRPTHSTPCCSSGLARSGSPLAKPAQAVPISYFCPGKHS